MKDSKSDSDGVTVRRPRRRPRPPLEERPGGGGERTEPAAPDTRTTKTRRVAHTQTDENNDSNDTRTIVPATPTTPIPWTHTATEPTPTTAASATRWFRVAAATTSQASFWKRHDHCISGLVAASAALCASQKKKNQTISPNSSCSEEQNQDDDAPLLKIFTTAVQHDILVSCRSVVADLTASAAAATTSKTIAAAASSSSSSKSSANTSINRNSKHLKELSSNTTTAASSKSSTSSSTTTAARINALYVAVHGLRAVLYCIVTTTSNAHSNNLTHDHLPASVGSKNTEGIIRLLYHCILSAASMAAAAVESPTRTTATTITRSEEHGRGSSWLDLCGAAYQALGAAFRNYSSIPLLAASTTTIPKNNSNAGSSANWAFAVVPPPPSFNNTDNADNPADDNDTFLLKEEDNPFLGFPVPQWQQSSLELGPPPRQPQQEQTSGQKQQQQQIEQFASMGIAATLAASRVLAAHATSTTKDDAGAPLNQSSDHTLAQQPTRITKTAPAPTRITRQSSVPLLRHLIKQTSMSWMVFAASSLPRDKTVTNGKSTPKPDTTAAARDFAVHTKDESVVDDVSLLEPAAIAAHCKVAHRILWSLGAADESLEWRDTVLLLRQDAIQALFLHGGRIYSCNAPSATANATTSTDTSMYASDAVMTVLRESHFETACTQSWKVAEAYAATESSKLPRTPETRCLRQFHENVGSLLDASAKSTTTTTLTNDIPTSYAEYCAYRALHTTRNDRNVVHDICGSSDCLFRCFRYPPPYHTTCRQSAHCAHDRKNTAVLAAFFLSLHVRQCIVDGVDSTAEALATEGKLERVHVIIKNFQSLVLRARSDTATDDAISELRLYKLFSSVNLHRAVSNVLGDKEKAEVSSLSTVKYGKMFRLAASILGNCIGPFYLDLLSRVEKKHSSVLFALGTSSLRLAIATSEALNCDVTVPSTDPQLKAWMETLVKISIDVPCIDHQQRLDNCENHAKFLYSVGKKRFEQQRKTEAIEPLLLALKMFLHLSQSLQSPKGLTISSRFVCLSTVYKSLQLYDEAIIATSLALTFDAIEVSETTPNINFRDPLANLVVSLVNCSKDVIVMATKHDDRAISELRMGLARSLVQMLAERKRSIYRPRRLHKSELVSLAPGQAIELLMNAVSVDADIVDLFEERCGVEFCLGGICETFFGISFARPQQQSKPFALLVEHTKTIIGIMVKLANVFRQGGNTLPEETTVSFADYHLCCQMAETNILEICSEDKSASEVLICLLFVVASVSLLFHPIFNYKSGNVGAHGHLIEKYALAAQIAIKMSTHTNQWKLLTSAVSLAVDFYAAQISNADQQAYKCYREKLIPIMRVVESLNTADEKSQVFVSIITRGLVTLLSRLCCVSAQDGEVLHAAQFSIWNLDVAKMDGADQHSWFEATSLSRMVPDFVAPIRLVHQDSLPSLQPASLELRACRLRLMLLDTENFCNVDLIQSNFISSLADVDSMNQSNENELLLRWTRSTILLGLSECAEKSANFELALRFSKQCFEECKTVTTFLKTLRGSLFSSQDQFWIKVAVSSLPILCIERQVQCLERLAHHHSRLHDHRKAIEYALLAANPATIEILGPLTQLSFAEILDILRANPSESCQDTRTRRLILRLKTQSYPLDKVLTAFKGRVVPHSLSSIGDVQKSCSATHDLEAIKDLFEIFDMLNGYQVHSLTSDEQELHRNATIQLVRFTLAPELSMLLDSFSVLSSRNSQPVFQLQYDAKLRDAVLLLADNNKRDFHANATAIDWLNNLADSLNCSNSCRAWSCFLLGHLSLEKARKSGLLQRLWDQTKCPPTSSVCLEEARKHFTRALRLLGSSSGLLKRNVQRSLALANGPGKINSIDSLATFRLINSSIGFSVRRQMMKMMESNSCLDMQGDDNVALCSGEETTKLFMEKLEQVLPSSWRFVTAGLCPSGELLMTSVEIGDSTKTLTYRNACLFPESVQEKDAGFRDLFDEIVKPLNEFLFSNQAQLSEEDSVDNRNKTNVEGHARRWWNMRKECDEDLNALLFKVERVLLSTEATEEILLGSFQQEPCPVDHMSNVATPRRNLAARFDAASTNGDPGANRSNMDVDAKKDPKRQDVVKCSNDEADNGRNMKGNKSSRYTQKCYDHDEDNDCTFLILDENLQRFPFESLQCFNGRIICRLPSLSFALARLMKADNDEPADKHRLTDFNPSRISYILDPECNLNATQERLKPFLDSLNEKFENDWTAIVGESPSADFMERALSTADGLLLYFGHGGGQQYFSRSKIEALGRRRGCDLSSIILMGCSSGKLESVNTKNSTSVSKLPMHFEPEGLALSYLIAGAPCVVGNLWDVTDRDIDRFSVALLDGIFKDDNGTSQSIAICVAQARSACKMRYAVGCAPVCYGFPIRMQARKR